jgi:hypothetical protein
MRLFRRNKAVQTPSEDLWPVATPPATGNSIDWRRAVPRLAGLAVVLALLVTGALWAVGTFKDNKPDVSGKNKPSTSKPDSKSSDESGESYSNTSVEDKTSNKTATSQSGTTASKSSSDDTAASNQTNGELSDTGPGDVLAVFAVATAGGTVIYQTVIRRRYAG